MFSTALLIVVGLLIVPVCILVLNSSLSRFMDHARGAKDPVDPERVEALRQISRDIERGKSAGGFWAGSA